MNMFIRLIEAFFNDINLKLRMKTIKKSERKIETLKHKLYIEENCYKVLLKESLEFCKDISKNK